MERTATKKRKTIHSLVAGRAITEDNIDLDIRNHTQNVKKPIPGTKSQESQKPQKTQKKNAAQKSPNENHHDELQDPSGKQIIPVDDSDSSQESADIPEEEKYCLSQRFQPGEL